MANRPLSQTPASLVTDGRFNFGTFTAPFERINPLEADIVPGLRIPRALKALRLKEWQAFQLGSKRAFVMLALFNAKSLALAQVKVYDHERRRKYLYERKLPPWSLRLPDSLLDSETRYHGGDATIAFCNRLGEERIDIHLEIAESKAMPRLCGTVTASTAGCQPMVVCIPFAANRGMYSHKALMPVEGQLLLGDDELRFSLDDGHLLMDDHRGYYPYVMRWDWVTAAGRDAEGRQIGFNLTRNASIDPERYNENGLWVDGRLHRLPPVEFVRRDSQQPEVWTVFDREGRVELRFEVEVPGRVDINALVLRSRYRGPFGSFRGTLVDEAGQRWSADGLFGMGEDFYLRC